MTLKIEQAIEELDANTVRECLEAGYDPNTILVTSKMTALQELLLMGGDDDESNMIYAITKLLIAYGASVIIENAKDELQPLFCAVKEGLKDVVELLLDRGAKLDLKDEEGYTPLIIAVEDGNIELVEVILKYAEPSTLEQSSGHWTTTPLGLAMSKSDISMIKLLMKYGCNPYDHDVEMVRNIDRLPKNISQKKVDEINTIIASSGFQDN